MKNIMKNKILPILVLLMGLVFLVNCNNTEKPPEDERVTVIFDVNADDDVVQNEPSPVRVVINTAVAKPSPNPARRGYEFKGWYEKADGSGEAYDFSKPVTKNNFVLFAVWEVEVIYNKVTFDYSYDIADKIENVLSGEAVEEPAMPIRDNYKFDGWYLDESFTSKYNFAEIVLEDITLYAKWIEIATVTFDFNYTGAPEHVVVEVEIGASVEAPKLPTREEYVFAGWYIDKAGTLPFALDEITASITAYAKWVEKASTTTYNVTFDYNYEGAPDNIVQEVVSGGLATQVNTQREGYRFLGWHIDESLEMLFPLTTPVESDLTLYAKWAKTVKLYLDYNYAGAVNPDPMVVAENVAITPPQNPTRTGYTFAGWSQTDKGLIGYDFTEGISEETTIYAQWNKINVFEAENLNFDDFFGWGFSGNATGTDAILHDSTGEGLASNERYVTYLYGKDITLTYEIYSDREVSNVEMVLRLSAELKDIFIQSHKTPGFNEEEPVYTVKVNGVAIAYDTIHFDNVPGQSENKLKPFEDFFINNITLLEGKNVIELITDNELHMGGTMVATAPMVDCLKLKTYAVLTWEPVLTNY